jgi:hypothetical protein
VNALSIHSGDTDDADKTEDADNAEDADDADDATKLPFKSPATLKTPRQDLGLA